MRLTREKKKFDTINYADRTMGTRKAFAICMPLTVNHRDALKLLGEKEWSIRGITLITLLGSVTTLPASLGTDRKAGNKTSYLTFFSLKEGVGSMDKRICYASTRIQAQISTAT